LAATVELPASEALPKGKQLLFKRCSTDVRSSIEALSENRLAEASSDLVSDVANVPEWITHNRSPLLSSFKESVFTSRPQTSSPCSGEVERA